MKYISFIIAASLLFACHSKKKLTDQNAVNNEFILEQTLPEINITSNTQKPSYQASAERFFDLLHTSLEVSFNYEKQQLYGKAKLSLKPYFYSSNNLQLDAKKFDIHHVKLYFNGIEKRVKYSYDSLILNIELDRFYEANETFDIFIDYTANPNRITEKGSNAITDRKGLYFINPLGEEKNKPTQIWTQGETESSSCWFPTIDKPNERCTQEITITVPQKYKTLSNGILISSKTNTDGSRSDYWKMDKPHAPYLFMMAVGDFAIVTDKWKNKEISYYVEPQYKDDARSIFKYTDEMLSFYSNILGIEYPWQKFSQVIVRDFVSGAMENTTAVVYGDFCQRTKRENIDENPAEDIIAHEMFHHWFGDYVTTESWSNLTLNESFADYAEYLWIEHKHGKDEADYHAIMSEQGYFSQTNYDKHPLVHFYYNSREDMFDAHSYNKGGLILHMLRKEVGDRAFFAALNDYLTSNAYTSTEAHQLRLSFEKITGRDLNHFFNQWYFTASHPMLTYQHRYNAAKKTLSIQITQDSVAQNSTFSFPLMVKYYLKNGTKIEEKSQKTFVNKSDFLMEIPCETEPVYVNYDSENNLLCQKDELNKSLTSYYYQYLYGDFRERWESIKYCRKQQNTDTLAYFVLKNAISDASPRIRKRAVEDILLKPELINTLKNISKNDAKTLVRAEAIQRLGDTKNPELIPFLQQFAQDSSYAVISATIDAINFIDKEAGYKIALQNKSETGSVLKDKIAFIIAQNAKSDDWQFMKQYAQNDDEINFAPYNILYTYLKNMQNNTVIQEGIALLSNAAMNNSSWLMRNMAYSYLKNLRKLYQEQLKDKNTANRNDLQNNISLISANIDKIRANEQEEKLKDIYKTDIELEQKE